MKRQFEATLHRVLDELETLGFPLPAQGALCSRSGVCSALKEAGGRDSISQSWSMAWGELGLSLHCRCFCVSSPGVSLQKPSPKGLGEAEAH
jgi:hypothetical protein